MKKVIANFYLIVILALCAQAIFVVIAGNSTTISRLKYQEVASSNDQIIERINLLSDKIAQKFALANLGETIADQGYVAIDQNTNIAVKQPLPTSAIASLE